jgi:hypothetical protein
MIKTASIGEVGSMSLAQGWINPIPYEKLADGRIIIARTDVNDAPFLYYLDHVVQPDDWERFVQLLDSKLHGATLSEQELQMLSFVLKARVQSSAYEISFGKDTISGRDGFLGWVTANGQNLKALPFIYPVKRTPQILIEEIGCEGPTGVNRELWIEGLSSLTKSVEWLHR